MGRSVEKNKNNNIGNSYGEQDFGKEIDMYWNFGEGNHDIIIFILSLIEVGK